MEYSNYAFILHDMAAAKGRRVISRRNARVYRGICGEISVKTDDEIARKLGIACGGVRRIHSNTVELTNGNRISWQRE